MKIRIITFFVVAALVLGVNANPLAAQENSESFKTLLEQRIKENLERQEKEAEKKEKEEAQREAEEKQRQRDTCTLIKEALHNYFEVWASVASELDAELVFDIGDPPDKIEKNVGVEKFIDEPYEKCSFYFIDQILWDRNISRKAYFKFYLRSGNESKPYYITIYSSYYNPQITLPELKSQWVPLYNRRHISQKTIVALHNPQRLVRFKEDIKKFLIHSMK